MRLHPKKGLNPHLTVCPRCGKDGPELLLLGAVNKIYKCTPCNTYFIGKPDGGACPKCCVQVQFDRDIHDNEHLPGDHCDECKEELEVFNKVVEEGGIFWKCDDCKQTGVIKAANPLSKAVRKKMEIAAPKPCGVAFTKKECPACNP